MTIVIYSEPLFFFRKLLFYGGTLWLGASFLIILRINCQKRRGLIIGISESAKERGAIPTSIIWTDSLCGLQLMWFPKGELVFWPGDIGAPKQLAM